MVTDEGGVNLPEEGRQSLQTITSDSITLADNARRFVLRVGRQVPQSVLRELFGVSSVDGAVAANVRLLTRLAGSRGQRLRPLGRGVSVGPNC